MIYLPLAAFFTSVVSALCRAFGSWRFSQWNTDCFRCGNIVAWNSWQVKSSRSQWLEPYFLAWFLVVKGILRPGNRRMSLLSLWGLAYALLLFYFQARFSANVERRRFPVPARPNRLSDCLWVELRLWCVLVRVSGDTKWCPSGTTQLCLHHRCIWRSKTYRW